MPDYHTAFLQRLDSMPLIAILRGISPVDIESVCDAILDSGISIIEVPLNSPEPFRSIEIMAQKFAGRAIMGAGTVLDTADVQRCHDAGAQLIVSPNMREDVIRRTVALGMISAPGCITPTECFAALGHGAHAVKLFPGEMISPAVVKAMRAVVPGAAPLLVVGGVTIETLAAYRRAGATGFGIGSAIYKAGDSAAVVAGNANGFAQKMRDLSAS